jgi:hypothetical protein
LSVLRHEQDKEREGARKEAEEASKALEEK